MDNEQIEDNIPTDEERQRLRLKRLTEIGKLPLNYGILTVILSPDKDIVIQADGLVFFEILGLAAFVRVKTEQSIVFMDSEEAKFSDNKKETIM